jgi:hypothetical protein
MTCDMGHHSLVAPVDWKQVGIWANRGTGTGVVTTRWWHQLIGN